MLKLENIVAGYGHITALKDISLEVPQGSWISWGVPSAIFLPKLSTTKRSQIFIINSMACSITTGQDITGRQTYQVVKNGISLVPEGRQILQDMSVYENLEMGAYTLDKFDDL